MNQAQPWEQAENAPSFVVETQKVSGGKIYKHTVRDSPYHSVCFVPNTETVRVVPIDVQVNPKVELKATCVVEPIIIPSVEIAAPSISVAAPLVTVSPNISVPVKVEPNVTVEAIKPTFNLSPKFTLQPTFEVKLVIPPTLPQQFVSWIKSKFSRNK